MSDFLYNLASRAVGPPLSPEPAFRPLALPTARAGAAEFSEKVEPLGQTTDAVQATTPAPHSHTTQPLPPSSQPAAQPEHPSRVSYRAVELRREALRSPNAARESQPAIPLASPPALVSRAAPMAARVVEAHQTTAVETVEARSAAATPIEVPISPPPHPALPRGETAISARKGEPVEAFRAGYVLIPQVASKSVPVTAEPAQSPQPAVLPPMGTPRNEEHSIEVRIGRIEVTAPRPPAVQSAPSFAPRPRRATGFERFALARRYLDRAWY